MESMAMSNKHGHKVKWRVLVIALSILLIQANVITVFGYDVDDLREFSGVQRINTEEYRQKQNIIINAYNEQMQKKAQADSFNSSDIAAQIEEKRSSLLEERGRLEESISIGMANNDSADNIIGVIKQIESIDKDLLSTEMKIPELIVNDEELEKQYSIAEQSLNKANEKFELGEIGERMKCPVEDLFRIYYTYGNMRNPYNLDEIWLNNGVYFAIPKQGSDIRVQWNGVVKKVITNDPVWGTYVVVNHGDNLETSYSFLDKVSVYEGQTLNQYDTIGYCNNTYMYFEVILDGMYINPFRLYGSTGVKEYYSWMNSHPELIIDYDDMTDIKNYVEKPEENSKPKKEKELSNTEDTIHVKINDSNK